MESIAESHMAKVDAEKETGQPKVMKEVRNVASAWKIQRKQLIDAGFNESLSSKLLQQKRFSVEHCIELRNSLRKEKGFGIGGSMILTLANETNVSFKQAKELIKTNSAQKIRYFVQQDSYNASEFTKLWRLGMRPIDIVRIGGFYSVKEVARLREYGLPSLMIARLANMGDDKYKNINKCIEFFDMHQSYYSFNQKTRFQKGNKMAVKKIESCFTKDELEINIPQNGRFSIEDCIRLKKYIPNITITGLNIFHLARYTNYGMDEIIDRAKFQSLEDMTETVMSHIERGFGSVAF